MILFGDGKNGNNAAKSTHQATLGTSSLLSAHIPFATASQRPTRSSAGREVGAVVPAAMLDSSGSARMVTTLGQSPGLAHRAVMMAHTPEHTGECLWLKVLQWQELWTNPGEKFPATFSLGCSLLLAQISLGMTCSKPRVALRNRPSHSRNPPSWVGNPKSKDSELQSELPVLVTGDIPLSCVSGLELSPLNSLFPHNTILHEFLKHK